MEKILTAIFTDIDDVNNAVKELHHIGLPKNKISIVIKNEEKPDSDHLIGDSDTFRNIASGFSHGGIIGGLIGMVSSISEFNLPLIPGKIVAHIRPLFGLNNPILATVSGTFYGALIGGFIIFLAKLIIPKTKVAERDIVNSDREMLISVESEENNLQRIERIFRENHADEISILSTKA